MQKEKTEAKKARAASGKGITTADIAVASVSAALITVCAWISVPIVVPVTLQTFAVFAVAGLFGMKRSVLAVGTYLAMAAIGLPVLSGFKGGADKLIGPTGGYIVGFVCIALMVGAVSDRTQRKLLPTAAAMVVSLLLCYALGTAWFMVVYTRTVGAVALGTVLEWCVLPFLIPDCVKLILAAAIADRLGKRIGF